MANIYDNLAKNSTWTRGDWKDVSTASNTMRRGQREHQQRSRATCQQGDELRNKVKAKAKQEGYSNKTRILSKETDMIWETAAKIKTWSAVKENR